MLLLLLLLLTLASYSVCDDKLKWRTPEAEESSEEVWGESMMTGGIRLLFPVLAKSSG